MITVLSPSTATRLEKAAVDNGFDLPLPREGEWLGFASSHAPLRIWLGMLGDELCLATFSQAHVGTALNHGTPIAAPLPPGAAAGRTTTNIQELDRMLRRAFQLSRTLPDELLHVFEAEIRALPRETEAERLVVQRVGQDVFRNGLLEYWQSKCAVTGLAVPQLLRASHAKPWADCATDAERLDVFNGLLLAAHMDAAFDAGFMTVAEDGRVVVSDELVAADRERLGLDRPLRIIGVTAPHQRYLEWHGRHVFRQSLAPGREKA